MQYVKTYYKMWQILITYYVQEFYYKMHRHYIMWCYSDLHILVSIPAIITKQQQAAKISLQNRSHYRLFAGKIFKCSYFFAVRLGGEEIKKGTV